jgi:hypothetical protein
MATWRIHSSLHVEYRDPRVQDGNWQDCGRPVNKDICKFEDILAWAAKEGNQGDLVQSSRGFFFVQGAPADLRH